MHKANSVPNIFGFIFILLVFQSCAALKSGTQSLKVATDVERVKVLDRNGTLLGEAPGFVLLDRKAKEYIVLSYQDTKLEVPLETSYRWKDGFWPNIIMSFIFGPAIGAVGLGYDYFSGAAWKYQDLPLIRLRPEIEILLPEPRRIAIAPTKDESEFISDQLSLELSSFTRKRYPNAQVQSYEDTEAAFSEWSWNHLNVPAEHQRDALFHYLGVDHVVIAQTAKIEGGYKVDAKVYDIYREHVRDEFLFSIKAEESDLSTQAFEYGQRWLYSLVPNSIGVQRTAISANPLSIEGEGTVLLIPDNSGLFGTQLSVMATNLRAPQTSGILSAYFDWRSRVVTSMRKMTFIGEPTTGSLLNADPLPITWLGAGIGIGPEVGIDTPGGLIYMQFVPVLSYDYLIVQESRDYTFSAIELEIMAEFGYAVYLSDRIHMQVSLGSMTSPKYLNQTLTRYYGKEFASNFDSITSVGLSLSYFFPEGRTRLKRSIRDF